MNTSLSAALVARLAGIDLPEQFSGLSASGVAFHTGRLEANEIFFALAGENVHGVRFADDALAKGAAFVVSDRAHPNALVVKNAAEVLLKLGAWAREQITGPVVGITGSAGKTSTKTFVAAALNAHSSPGNFNTTFALAQSLIKHALYHRDQILVLELGIDHLDEMKQLVNLVKPSHGILTNVGPAHLAALGSIEGVAKEKSDMFSLGAKALVSNQASPLVKQHIATFQSYGLEAADYTGQLSDDETQLSYKNTRLSLPSVGKNMAANAVAALALAETLELDLNQAAKRIEEASMEGGRLEFKRAGNLLIIDDTYNSNPLSVKPSLDILKKQAAPHVAILGDMLELGAYSHAYHHELGELSRGLATFAIGRESLYLLESNTSAKHYLTVDAFLSQLPDLTTGTVLVKGSRGMKLERVVAALIEANS